MLAFNRLRIDPGNGSPAVDYRIENGFVRVVLWRRMTQKEVPPQSKRSGNGDARATNLPSNGRYGAVTLATSQNGRLSADPSVQSRLFIPQ